MDRRLLLDPFQRLPEFVLAHELLVVTAAVVEVFVEDGEGALLADLAQGPDGAVALLHSAFFAVDQVDEGLRGVVAGELGLGAAFGRNDTPFDHGPGGAGGQQDKRKDGDCAPAEDFQGSGTGGHDEMSIAPRVSSVGRS